jgi:hypothetical protein
MIKSVDYSVEHERRLFEATAKVLSIVNEIKSRSYGKSWRKRGHFSAIMNVLRKTDRLENLLLDKGVSDVGSGNENIIATVMDLAAYSNMWFGLLAASYPEETKRVLLNEGLTSEESMIAASVVAELHGLTIHVPENKEIIIK